MGARLLNGLNSEERETLLAELLIEHTAKVEMTSAQAQKVLAAAQRERAFHWFLEFPEVFKRGGFDAFVGNPPFMGGSHVSTHYGDSYLRCLKVLYPGYRDRADLCAVFFVRAFSLLQAHGVFGLLATNTIAQGDTREASLDQIIGWGGTIYRAVSSMLWPGRSASVYVSVVHVSRAPYKQPFNLDEKEVGGITGFLQEGTSSALKYSLAANAGFSHRGTDVNGEGFIISAERARRLILDDRRNADVLFPYVMGQELNSAPTFTPSDWIINFHDWPLDRAEEYSDVMEIVREKVFQERQGKGGGYARYWWQYGRRQDRLYEAIAPLKRLLIVARTSKTLGFTFIEKGMVYGPGTVVFAFDEYKHFALLQSSFHILWVLRYGSSLKGDARYTPTDCFETFPFPTGLDDLEEVGYDYYEYRRSLMLARGWGLTAIYNKMHDPGETSSEISRLRECQRELDRQVATAYGWRELSLEYAFASLPQGIRFTLVDAIREVIFSRLLALNHRRYAEEVAAGLHEKDKPKAKKGKAANDGGTMKLF